MFKDRVISEKATLLDAFKKMDDLDRKLLIVVSGNLFKGLISVGDIQRAIINDMSLSTNLLVVLRKNIKIARPDDSFAEVKKMMFEYRMELCPVVTEGNEILKVFFWEDLFQGQKFQPKSQFNLPVVIMAGGLGTRLRPLTHVLPKPLIPVGEKTMLEQIFDRFSHHGSKEFYLSVNYKAELIEYYLNEQRLPYTISYIRENQPMGTAGSLSMLNGIINKSFFVSNCDILIDQDYSEILEYHRENENEITIVAVLKHYPIPYGIVETGKNGSLTGLSEKPDLTFKINSGMYILEPHLLNEIPNDQMYHITHLIEAVKRREGRVGVYPVSEGAWKDIGNWKEYMNNSLPIG